MNKKTFLRRTLFFLMCLYGTSSVCALEVTIDGLVYDLSGTSATVLHVASGNTNQVIEIPSSVNYDGLTYTVKSITGCALVTIIALIIMLMVLITIMKKVLIDFLTLRDKDAPMLVVPETILM